MRKLSITDRLLSHLDQGLKTLANKAPRPQRPNPGQDIPSCTLDKRTQRDISGMMRVNHTGEVCAQALYLGQSLMARDPQTRKHLLHAAQEEQDHLIWTQTRLNELSSHGSYLNPFWFGASYVIGAAAGFAGDTYSYGFVEETEYQVMAHLERHLDKIPNEDQKSRAILKQMHQDEAHHAHQAKENGAKAMPWSIKILMKCQSKVMTTLAYYI